MPTIAQTSEVTTISHAAKVLDEVWGRWEEGGGGPVTERLYESTEICCAILRSELPTMDDKLIYDSGLLFAKSWTEWRATSSPTMPPVMLAHLENVRSAYHLAEVEEEDDVRTVADALDEFGDWPGKWEQVAREFGKWNEDKGHWEGPFFTKFGMVAESKIRQEAEKPGSVLGNFQKSSATRRREEFSQAAKSRLQEVSQRLFDESGDRKPEPATVLELLQDGQYPDVIAELKGVSLREVAAVAKEHGIELKDRDAELRSAVELLKPEDMEPDLGFREGNTGSPVEDVDPIEADSSDDYIDQFADDDSPELNVADMVTIEGDELKSFLSDQIDIDPSLDTSRAMASLAAVGKGANPRSVTAHLTNIRKGK